jgi:hypothetical protein
MEFFQTLSQKSYHQRDQRASSALYYIGSRAKFNRDLINNHPFSHAFPAALLAQIHPGKKQGTSNGWQMELVFPSL